MAKLKTIAWMLILVLAITGCAAAPKDATEANLPDINPKAESANKDTKDVTLYFSYNGEQLLAGETRPIEVSVSEKLEAAVINALIAGPSSDRDELVGLFWDGVSLVNIESNADILFVTLSDSFVTTEPKTTVLDEGTVQDRKRLAIYSIVNTITEIGTYSSVQIFIDKPEGAQRITLSEAGFGSGTNDKLEPLPWTASLSTNESLILTPENTLKEALDSYSKKNWERLYDFTAYSNTDGSVKPDMDDFYAALAETGNVLNTFSITGVNVAYDGQSAIVLLSYSINTRQGELIAGSSVPVVLVREEEIWKLSYTSLANVLMNER